MEGKYAVKLSIREHRILVGNEGNVIMVPYGKCKCGLAPVKLDLLSSSWYIIILTLRHSYNMSCIITNVITQLQIVLVKHYMWKYRAIIYNNGILE